MIPSSHPQQYQVNEILEHFGPYPDVPRLVEVHNSVIWADTGPRNATFAETQHVQQIRVIFCIPLLSFLATCLGRELSVPQLLQGKFHRKGLYSEATTIIFGME